MNRVIGFAAVVLLLALASAAPAQQAIFVAGGHSGLRMISRNGTDWTNRVLGREGQVYRGFCFGQGKCVGVDTFGNDSILAVTTDGATWESYQKKHPAGELFMQGITFGLGRFLAYGGNIADDPGTYYAYRSADAVRWDEPIWQKNGKNLLRRIIVGDGVLVGVGDRGRRAVSKDGITWQSTPDYKAADTLIDVAFGNGIYVGVGLNGLRLRSRDGLTWTDRQVGEPGEHLNAVGWCDGRFVAVGLGATYVSPDGAAWQRTPNRNAPLTMAYGNGVFVGSHWKGRILMSRDAIDWRQVYQADQHIETVAFGSL